MNLRDIVEKYLRENRFDGLCDDAGGHLCCCRLDDDFMHCGEPTEHCEPGYAFDCDTCPKADPQLQRTIYGCDVETEGDDELPRLKGWCMRVNKEMDNVAPADFLKAQP
jgi:hypothetical protein